MPARLQTYSLHTTAQIRQEITAGEGMTLLALSRSLPAGLTVSYKTLWSWAQRGTLLRRDSPPVQLESARLGGTLYSSLAALQRYMLACASASTDTQSANTTKQTRHEPISPQRRTEGRGMGI